MKNIPFYLALLITFGLAGFEKILAGEVPDWFLRQFKNSILDSFSGSLKIAYFSIAAMELLTFGLLLLGLAFYLLKKKGNEKLLMGGVFLAQLTFVSLSFGQRLTHQYEAAGSLFIYAILTFLGGQLANWSLNK
jgi:hypothetical protein